MSERPFVEVFCDGNAMVGYGHIRRASTLAARLKQDGIDVRLSGLSDFSRKMLPVSDRIGQTPSVVVFDSHFGIDSHIRDALEHGLITVTLDWFGETLPHVNIAVYPHGEVRSTVKSYVGFEYILIRDEIARIPRQTSSGKASRVLIVIGGGDLLGQAHQAARYLCDKGLEVDLVQGPLAKNINAADGYRVLVNPPEFPKLLAGCDWAVTNGGGCLFEAFYLCKPALAFPQSDAEMRISRFAQKRDAVLGIGLDSLQAFRAEALAAVSENAGRLVDGRGAERVSTIVQGLL